jgi:protein-S-isoprenylcysteine O-methyltransferase Ste14
MESGVRTYEKTKVYDLATALPLIGFYGWSAWAYWPPMLAAAQRLGRNAWDTAAAADVLVRILSIVFVGTLVVLLLMRRVPSGKSGDVLPRLAAVLGTFASIGFLRLPGARLPSAVYAASVILILIGIVATIMALLWLGRSFSIMPEARRLVMRGPYRMVRHPVYLFEELTLFGIMLQHAQPESLVLYAAQFALQLVRIRYEEEVLAAAFPEYGAYAARTARLIPGIY